MQWIVDLTQPQATLGAAVVSFTGAIVAVFIGWGLFRSKVNDLKSALKTSEELVVQYQANVARTLEDIELKIGGLVEGTGQLRAEVSDNRARDQDEQMEPSEQKITTHAASELPTISGDLEPLDSLAANWASIRDRLEEIAADPTIDGRTSAKYARVDRRRYGELIRKLEEDGRLGRLAGQFYEAAQIWNVYRSRRKLPEPSVVSRMSELANNLT